MKKVILGVLALVFAIALVVGGYILITSRNLQTYSVEDATCPYSWQELRSGRYRVEINTEAYPDHSWSVESYPKNIVAVSEVSNESGTAVYSILPLNEGQAYVQVYCEQTEPIRVRVFEIGMQVSVSEDGRVKVEKTEETDHDGVTTLGEDGDYPVQWWADPDGTVNLMIAEESSGSWEAVEYDPNSIQVAGPFYRQGSCGFELRSLQAGTFPLTIYDGTSTAIHLEVDVSEALTAVITNMSVDTYTFDRSEEHVALEAVLGRGIALPPKAVVTGYSVKSESGSVDFLLNDKEWRWQIAADETEAEQVGALAAVASETKTDVAGGVTLTAYRFKEGVIASWSDGNHTMALHGEPEADVMDALDVARQIVEANDGQ